ncbi:MAG TPA: PrsW family glutamic-type intramembrane protease [Galbitalea sp.]|jgi:RsiW-degrading membrane proteinase PrsW (M82 family)|nr:PrsW family glutamic-type intramembrane protease [Galbitalea sp.]
MTDPSAPPLPPARPTRPPRKWLGPKGGWFVFLAFTFFWFCNVLFDALVVKHVSLSTNTLVLGGFGMTAALIYTLAYRLRPAEGITVVRLLLAFLLGGLGSTQLALLIELPLALGLGTGREGTLVLHSLAGVIEEACKILAVLLAARGLTVRTAHTGLFVGGAVGLGFAAFEDMRYASAILGQPSSFHSPLTSVIVLTFGRDLLGPLEHPIMTTLLAAALFAATRQGKFRITGKVVLVYLGVAAVHGLIDTSPDLFGLALPAETAAGLGLAIGILLALALGVVWLVYSRRVRDRMLAGEAAELQSASPVGSTASGSFNSAPPTGSPSQ